LGIDLQRSYLNAKSLDIYTNLIASENR
jgi:hypothetical protein